LTIITCITIRLWTRYGPIGLSSKTTRLRTHCHRSISVCQRSCVFSVHNRLSLSWRLSSFYWSSIDLSSCHGLRDADRSLMYQSFTSTVTMDQEAIDRRPNTAYCRALYDYKATDTSSLSFRKNDILEVVNRLESGWWDGFLGELRGWFPSNYVAFISD
jgi:hypothetical protein